MRPSSITQPGAVLRYRLGPASPDQAPDSPPPPDCCVLDEGDLPDRGATENGAYTVKLSTGGTPTIVQTYHIDPINAGQIIFDSPPTPGNTLIMLVRKRDATPTDPPLGGWTEIDTANMGADGCGIWYRVATADESAVTAFGDGVTYPTDDSNTWAVGLEVTGGYASIKATLDDQVSGALACGGTVAAPDGSLAVGVTIWGAAFPSGSVTPDAGVTEIDDELFGGFDPAGWFAYRTVPTAASVAVSGTRASTDWAGVTAVFGGIDPAWVTPAPSVSDESDATYDEVDNDELYRTDLGAAYRIVRTRIRIATTTAGARTLTLRGATMADYSDAVVVATISFTATGSLTAQDVTGTWYTEDSYRYWQLDASVDEVYRTYSWELYEATLSTNHQHDGSTIGFDNTEADLPGDPDTMQEAIEAILNKRWEAVTDGEDVFVWEDDDLVHEWKVYA